MNTREIKLKIHEESDLFSPFDPDGKLLSEDVCDHLSRYYLNVHRSLLENFTLHIFSDTPVDAQNIRQRFREHFSQQVDNLNYRLKRLTLKEAWLLGIGAVILAIWVIVSAKAEGVNVEILSIMGWVAVWEATSIAIMEKPELRREREVNKMAMKADILVDVTDRE